MAVCAESPSNRKHVGPHEMLRWSCREKNLLIHQTFVLQDTRDWVVSNDELLTRLMKCWEAVDSRGKIDIFPDIDTSFSLVKHRMNIDELLDKLHRPSCEWTPAPKTPKTFLFNLVLGRKSSTDGAPWEESCVVIQTEHKLFHFLANKFLSTFWSSNKHFAGKKFGEGERNRRGWRKYPNRV